LSAPGAESAGLTEPTLDPAAADFPTKRQLGDHVFANMGLREVAAATGDYAMEMPVSPYVANNRGGLQGGLLATLVDIVAGLASLKGMPEGISAATADLNLHFLSAVRIGPAHAEATVVRRGKRTIVTQVEVHDVGRDVLAAIATATFHIIELRPDQIDQRAIDRPKS
jgi:uncharacterized protein (TIGR00369 family)